MEPRAGPQGRPVPARRPDAARPLAQLIRGLVGSRPEASPPGFALLAAATLLALGCGAPAPVVIPAPENPPPPPSYAKPLGAAVSVEPARDDDAYRRDLLEAFSSVTPENAMKWEVVHPREDDYEFAQADSIVDYAVKTGKRVRGHPLVWDQQLPDWVTEKDLEAVLREHVTTLVERYRGRVAMWDVVNEPLDNDGTLTRSVFVRALGERFIDVAFEAARRADPEAQLFLNELSAERAGPKLRALVALAERLKARGVPIDGIGLQNHTTLGNPPDERELAAALRRFERLGLRTEITEMDVAIPPSTPTSAAVLDRQAEAYAAAARACAAAPSCTGLTVWGVTDRWSWLGAEKRPLPFGADGAAKPAAAALGNALSR